MSARPQVGAPRRGFALCGTIGLIALSVAVVLLPSRAALADPGPDQGQVAIGDAFACAIRSDSTVACWGPAAASPPADLGPVKLLAATYRSACAIRSDDVVRCWGENNHGDAIPPPGLTAVAFSQGTSDVGLYHLCAVRPDQTLACWGQNDSGQTDVPSDLGTVTGAATGNGRTCAVRTDETVRCWGGDSTVPSGLGPVRALAGSNVTTCAVLTDATLRCWGGGGSGEDTPPLDLDAVVALTPWARGYCALRTNGDVRCWGAGSIFTLNNPPADLGAVRAIATGPKQACATQMTGRLRCWGVQASGQAPAFSSGPPPSPVGRTAPYSHTFTAGGAPSARYSVVAGSLPPGLALDGITGVLSGTPTTPGTSEFTIMASNEFFAPDATQAVTITVTNAAPTAGNDTYNTAEDTALPIAAPGVRGNDADAEDDAFTAAVVVGPAHGQVDLQPGGAFVYTPAAQYHGPDSFTYRQTDSFNAESAPATVSLTVTPVNDAPAAQADILTVDEDTAGSVTVTANDTDVDGDTLTAVALGNPLHGDVDCTGTACTYTPDPDFHGADSFAYNAVDNNGGAATAQVAVTVTAVNDLPAAVDDADTTPEDLPVEVAVLQNDTDVDGDTLEVAANGQPTNGLVLCTGATCRYVPAPNFNGTDTFTYTVSDGHGGEKQATVSITISAENDAPAAEDDTWTSSEDGPLTVAAPGLLDNDDDADGDDLTVRLVSGVDHGELDLHPDGSFEYVPDRDFNGLDSFTYQANDGGADSEPVTVHLRVTAVNDAPVPADDTASTSEGSPADISVAANDRDVDGDVLAVVDIEPPVHGTVACSAERVCTYRSRVPFSGIETFGYTVSDGKGGQARGIVRVTVTPVRGNGYWLLGEDGQIYPFGSATSYGDGVGKLAGARATDLEPTPSLNGYWITDDRGRVHTVGDAAALGSVEAPALPGDELVVAMALTGTAKGYWLVTDRGRIFPFGDAGRLGDLTGVGLTAPIVDASTSAGGAGLYLVSADGGVFAFGDAAFSGSLGGLTLAGPVVSIAADPDGTGYWLAGADGGIFAFGAPFLGSVPPRLLNRPLSQIALANPGYLLVARDGGVFVFGPPFLGSLGDRPPPTAIVSIGAR